MYGSYFLGKNGGNLNKSMKIKYREPTLIEQMTEAIDTAKQPIDYFELSSDELNSNYSNFDRTIKNKVIHYSYKGVTIKVTDE
jgi:hypothetical protein